MRENERLTLCLPHTGPQLYSKTYKTLPAHTWHIKCAVQNFATPHSQAGNLIENLVTFCISNRNTSKYDRVVRIILDPSVKNK